MIFTRSSGSGFRSLACCHWNLRLEAGARAPIGVAEVVVDGRVAGLQLDGLLQLAHGLVVAAEAVIGPAQAVDDHAVARRELDRRFSILKASSMLMFWSTQE